VTSRGTVKDSAPKFREAVSALSLDFHHLGFWRCISEPELAGWSGESSQSSRELRKRWPEMF
jgi:hypothetical protein